MHAQENWEIEKLSVFFSSSIAIQTYSSSNGSQ